MAGRKKGSPVPPPDGARAFAVVVEQLRGEFKVSARRSAASARISR